MATTVGTSTVTAIGRHHVMPQITEAVYDSNALWFRLTKANKKQIQGGYQIELPVQYGRPTNTQAYSGYDVLNVAPFDVIQNASWDWKQYATTVAIDGLMEDAATAEISRSQVWQWIHQDRSTEDGTKITREYLEEHVSDTVVRIVLGYLHRATARR